jgi:endonuclease-3
MPTTTNKHRLLNQLFTALKRRYEPAEPELRPVLEQFLYAIIREGAPRERANEAFRNLTECFFDWNELRVSSVREIEEVLGDIPDAEARASRLVSFLQEVFETTFSFDLEALHKKGLKQAAKQLSRYQAANDYVVAWVTQHSLGGHAIPLDVPSARVLRRLGLLDNDSGDIEAQRASLEHLIPKARGSLFVELISAMAHDDSWEDDARFPLRSHLNGSAGEDEDQPTLSERVGRAKPR